MYVYRICIDGIILLLYTGTKYVSTDIIHTSMIQQYTKYICSIYVCMYVSMERQAGHLHVHEYNDLYLRVFPNGVPLSLSVSRCLVLCSRHS